MDTMLFKFQYFVFKPEVCEMGGNFWLQNGLNLLCMLWPCAPHRKKTHVWYQLGYNINIMRQSACLVFNPITVNNFASLFNCTPVGRASDSMMAPT